MKKALSLILSMLMLISCTMFVSAAEEPVYENDAKVALVFDEPVYVETEGTVTLYLNMFFEEPVTEITGATVIIDYDETKLTYQTGKKKSFFVYNDDEEFESTYDSISLNSRGDIVASFAATDPTYSIEGTLLQAQFTLVEGASGTCNFSILEASGNATTMYVLPDGTEDGKWQANTTSLTLAAPAVEQYTVTYENAKGAAPAAVTEDEGTTITVADAPAAVDGFTFEGWSDGTTTYQPGNTFELTGDVTLTAVWEEIPVEQYTVEYVNVKGAAPAAVTEDEGTTITVADAPAAVDGFTFEGWSDGTTTYQPGDTFELTGDVTLTAVWDDIPEHAVVIYDGDDTIASEYVYEGTQYTLPTPERVLGTRVLGFAADEGATVAEYAAGEKITVNAPITLYVIREAVAVEDASYTFEGRFDVANEKYTIDMYYEGPQANMTAFGVQYDTEILENLTFAYDDAFMTTGTNAVSGEGYIADVAWSTTGNFFGDDLKTPVLVGTFTADMTAEKYAEFDPATDFGKYAPAADIAGAFENGEWQFIKNDATSFDPTEIIYPITFTALVDNNVIAITTEGVDADITTVEGLETEGTMLTDITFTVTTAEGETPATVSYTVAGVSKGALVAEDDGVTYIIPGEEVLGDVVIIFTYLPAVEAVVITGIDEPVAGETPDLDAVAGDETYTVEKVEWTPAADEFEFDTAYTVTVTVKAEEGYTFSGETTYTINGETATLVSRDGDTLVISYTFEKTAEELGTVTVEVALVRDAADAAYKNFGTIKLVDAEGEVVDTVTEGTEAGDTFVATFEDVLAGDYTVVFEKNGYLAETSDEFTVVYDETSEVELTGVAGNVYGINNVGDDNVINLYDFARIVRAFEEGSDNTGYADLLADADYNGLVDVDEDGEVTVFDLAFVKSNYGETR